MKILIHHRTQGRGVEAVHLLGIAEGFRANGHSVSIVSPPGVTVSSQVPTTSAVKPRSWVYSLISKHAPEIVFESLELLNNFFAARLLELKKNEVGCDLLYERFALLNFIGMYKAKRWGVNYAVEVNYTTDSLLDIRQRTWIFAGLARLMERWTYQRADLLLPVSSTLAEELKNRGYPEEKILISPNATFPDKFKPMEQDLALKERLGLSGYTVLGYVGGFAPWHGLDILIEASSLLEVKDMKIGLLLIGDGPDMEKILALKDKYSDHLKIVLPGRKSHNELSGYLNLADMLIMPNSNDYGSPMKVFEYMSFGKPVLAPDYPPLRDVIVDKKDGLLFTPGSPSSLAKAIDTLLVNKELRSLLGNNARRQVVESHNWVNRAAKIIGSFDFQS